MKESHRMPEPAYRWVIVAAAALILGIAMGTLVNGLSAFLVPLEVHFGWDRAEVSAINSFGLIGIAIGGIAMGLLADRIATWKVCLTGAASLSLALLIAARCLPLLLRLSAVGFEPARALPSVSRRRAKHLVRA